MGPLLMDSRRMERDDAIVDRRKPRHPNSCAGKRGCGRTPSSNVMATASRSESCTQAQAFDLRNRLHLARRSNFVAGFDQLEDASPRAWHANGRYLMNSTNTRLGADALGCHRPPDQAATHVPTLPADGQKFTPMTWRA